MADLFHREKQKPLEGNCLLSSPNPQAYLYLSALLPPSQWKSGLPPEDSVKRLGFSIPSPVTFLEISLTPIFQPFFSNTQTRTYIFHLKTQNLPRFHSCPTTTLTLPPSFNATFLKKFKFLLSHLLPNLFQFGPYPYQAIKRFHCGHQGPWAQVWHLYFSLYIIWPPLNWQIFFFPRRYSFSLVSVISPSPDLPLCLPSFHCLFFILFILFSTDAGKAKFNFWFSQVPNRDPEQLSSSLCASVFSTLKCQKWQ